MGNRKTDAGKTAKKPGKNKTGSPDMLITKNDEKAELSEDELKDASGGSFSWGVTNKY
jgi:hypothetical protein